MNKVLKIGGIVVGILLVLAFGVPVFLASEMSVTETEVINAPIDVVFDQVNDLRAFTDWISWGTERDETMEIEFSDPAVGEGAWYRWTGEESGHGTTTLVESVRPERLRMAITFEQGKMAASNHFRLERAPDGRTRITWELYMNDNGHPVHRYFLPIMESMVGPFLSEGLTSLKKRVESAPPPAPTTEVPESPEAPETPEGE